MTPSFGVPCNDFEIDPAAPEVKKEKSTDILPDVNDFLRGVDKIGDEKYSYSQQNSGLSSG